LSGVAVSPEIATSTDAASDRKLLMTVPAVLLVALIVIAFFPKAVAADTAVRVFLVLYLLIAAIDLLTLKVPNTLVYSSIAFALAATVIVDAELIKTSLLGAGASLVIMMVLALISKGAMGMGDVKVACFSGCVLGLKGGILSLMFGFILGAGVALPLVLLRLRGRKDVLPLAPFLAGGAIVYGVFFRFLLAGQL
jgi:leader peptidase (prepilin peptidase)/N-methyltransferase